MAMVKFAWRHNLIYPIHLLIWTFVRKINSIILDEYFAFSTNLLFTLIMFLAELLTGLMCFFYQQRFFKNQRSKNSSKDIYIYNKNEMYMPDSKIKIYFLIFVSAYFDFIEYILSTNYVPKFGNSSGSLDSRLGAILIVSSALFYRYVLNFPILRHQFFSLLIIGICLILIVLSELFYQDINFFFTYKDFIIKLILIFLEQLTYSFLDSSEKYVFEYDFVDHFQVLAIQGFFGLIITIIYYFLEGDTFPKQLSKVYSKFKGGYFALFIFLLFIYFILCGAKNAFRVVTNKIYNPMTKSLTDYFLNPINLIISYSKGDFKSGGKQNLLYFFINIIISIVINICGLVFNELVILFFWDLERDTHDQISLRSIVNYTEELTNIITPSEEDCEDAFGQDTCD